MINTVFCILNQARLMATESVTVFIPATETTMQRSCIKSSFYPNWPNSQDFHGKTKQNKTPNQQRCQNDNTSEQGKCSKPQKVSGFSFLLEKRPERKEEENDQQRWQNDNTGEQGKCSNPLNVPRRISELGARVRASKGHSQPSPGNSVTHISPVSGTVIIAPLHAMPVPGNCTVSQSGSPLGNYLKGACRRWCSQ